jgi:anaerobic ribonucleoside-triphosphate reductase activating protein
MSRIIRIDTLNKGNRVNCSANGTGVRVIVWFLGCDIRCTGCHNMQYWDFDNEEYHEFSEDDVTFIKEEVDKFPNIYSGLSILGGEPFSIRNIDDVIILCERWREMFPDKNIWIWSGHTLEWLDDRVDEYGEKVKKLLSLCDVLVDGEFRQEERNVGLKFRGSKNQRIIDLKTREVIS